MNDPFDLGDAVIRDLPHVRVTRHAPQAGRACEYRKIFKPDGLGDASYWIQRENEFLLDFTVKRLRHTVELSAFAQGGGGNQTPVVEWVATRDAGITIEDWLRVQPRYENGAVWQHPFQHAGLFLELLRACLAALKEIHSSGIVHCDIKEDNICLPYSPCPYSAGQSVRIDFEHIRLIDFAFSVTPERPLVHPLPILPVAPYQSNLLKSALSGDRSGKNRGRLAAQQLDFRVDLYSLGVFAGRILDAGLFQPAGPGGAEAMAGSRSLVDRLQGFDSGRRRGKMLPHDDLIGDIDNFLAQLVDRDAYRRFEVARIREAFAFAAEPAGSGGGTRATPLTPLATPLATSPVNKKGREASLRIPSAQPNDTRKLPVVLTLAVLAGLGLAGYWQATRPPSSQTQGEKKPPVEIRPMADGAANKQEAKNEAQRKTEAEAQFQAEAAKAKEEARRKAAAQAKAKAELAAEIRAEAEAQKMASPEPKRLTVPAETAPTGKAVAKIGHPAQNDSVGRSEAVSGKLEGLNDNQHAFLVIRSKAETYGRLYYPQGELPHTAEWTVKGVYGTPNYEYENFVVATENPQSVEMLRAPKNRAYGLQGLPEDTRLISGIVTVKRLQ